MHREINGYNSLVDRQKTTALKYLTLLIQLILIKQIIVAQIVDL
jgi:hypothetical protein